ncbi:hypothetical protein APHAL10511_008700 [Amanita phalloides]|nr:hypothetical protein APHAL10511_008700 [Amanita phalloides]
MASTTTATSAQPDSQPTNFNSAMPQSQPQPQSPPPPPAELRHVTSTTFRRSPKRASHGLLRTSEGRLGSRSPNSIPSSPTSVHSSSSAIFERDIEPVAPPSPPTSALLSVNPHRIPRAKTTEALESSVPSVLDSAAAVLTGLPEGPEAGDQVAVVTPASPGAPSSGYGFGTGTGTGTGTGMAGMGSGGAGRNSGFTSPIGSFRSRSPSPLGLRLAPQAPFVGAVGGQRAELLLSIPQTQIQTQAQASPKLPIQEAVGEEDRDRDRPRMDETPSIVTPTSTYFTTASSVDGDESSSSPTATSHDDHKNKVPAAGTGRVALPSLPLNVFPASSVSPASPGSHPPSPTHAATKRLSFMSYSDLVSCTPASTLPLSMLTTSASSIDPPPHLPSLAQVHCFHPHSHHQHHQHASLGTGSASGSVRGFPMFRNGARQDGLLDDVGGEWEREGFGKGLEERLEELMPVSPATAVSAVGSPRACA